MASGIFALGVLLVSACIVRLAASLERRKLWRSLAIVPSMCGMFVGWACGDASVKVLQMINENAQHARFCVACNKVNMAFSFAATVVTAVIILLLRPLTRWAQGAIPRGPDGPSSRAGCRALQTTLVAYAVALLELATQGLSYNSMMLWGFTSSHLITWGVDYNRMLLITSSHESHHASRL